MRKITILFIVLLLMAGNNNSNAQAPYWSGLYSFGGDLSNRGKAVFADSINVFMASQISGTSSFDGVTYTCTGTTDMLLVKSDLSGASVWKKQVSPSAADGSVIPSTIKTDINKNIYVVGRFAGSVTIGGSTIISGTSYNSFVARFDSSGNGVWVTAFNNIGTGLGGIDFNRIDFDDSGNIYIISRSNKLLKYSNSGIQQWVQNYPDRTLLALEVNGSNLYLGGALQTNTNFGSLTLIRPNNNYYNLGFLIKGDLDGNYSTSTVFSGLNGGDGSSVSDIAFDTSNNIILTGACSKQTIFGTITKDNPSSSVYNFIAKCDNNFNFIWVNTSSNTSSTREIVRYRIFLDNSNNIFLVGLGFPSITFNGITATNPNNSFFFKFTSGGTAQNGYNLPFIIPFNTFVTPSGKIYFTGGSNTTFGDLLYTCLNSDVTLNWVIESSDNTSAAIDIIYTKKDNSGNIYTLASFAGRGTYFGNTVNAINTIHLLTKCDASGNSIWMKQIEGYDGTSQQGAQIFVDKNNNILFTGTFSTSLTIGTTTFTNLDASKDGFIAVFAPDGTVTMLKQIASADLQEIDCIIKDHSGNIILSGIGKDLNLNGSQIPNVKNNDVFLVKLNASGNIIWGKFYSGDGSTGTDWLALVASDKNDNLFLSGEFHANPCDFGNISLPLPDGSGSVILAKISPDGTTLWAKSFSGVEGQYNDGWPDFIHSDNTGNVILYGWAPNNAIFENIILANPLSTGFSYFITKINTNGNVVWAKAIYEKTQDFNYGDNLDLDPDGNIYVAGHVNNDISIEGTVYPKSGIRELFVAKYDNDGVFKWIKKVTSTTSARIINGIAVYGNDSILVAGVSSSRITFGSYPVNTKGSNWGYLAVLEGKEPLTGTKTINPTNGDYISFSAAIADLNNKGVGSGGVTFLVAADAVFSDVNQTITTTGTAADPIKFIKNGTGANPLLQSKGFANSTGDYFIRITGGDYITFDGIDFITDPTVLENEKIEKVLEFYGNQYITVQNCTINQQAASNTDFCALVFNTQTFENPAGQTKFITINNVTFKVCNSAIKFNGNTQSFITDILIKNNQFGTASDGLVLNNSIVKLTNTSNIDIHHNTFQNITTDYMGFAISGNVGIGLNQIYNNKMFNFKSTHTGDVNFDIMGIYLTIALNAKLQIYNNLLYDFDAPDADVESANYYNLTPIFLSGTGKAFIYNNTIKMSSANPKISSTTCWVWGNSVVKNNIFVNTSVANTNSFSTIASYSTSAVFCNNIAFIDTTLSGHTFNGTTIEDFYNKVYSSGEIDSFINANINPNLDANLVPQNPSVASNNGIFAPKAVTDFNDVTRTGFDIGAFEGDFGPVSDIWFPAINYLPVENTTIDPVKLIASITDNVGVSANPKLWFRKSGSADAFASITGVYNSTSLTYTFTFPALLPGDFEYFVCAKDAAGNIISNPAIPGLSLTNTGLLVNNPAANSVTVGRFEYKLAQTETVAVSAITNKSAISGGIITSDVGSPVTARGVCWSTLVSPTIADSKTFEGTGTGTFTSSLAGLSPNTTYYVRAYATNSNGTAYGAEMTFKTLPSPNVVMNNNPVTTCYGTFYDSGGENGNYSDNEDFTKVFYPVSQEDKISFTFNSFLTEEGYDFLYIFDGPDPYYSSQFPGSPFSGTQSIGTITASPWNSTGAISFVFVSDGGVNDVGWEAIINVPVSDVNLYLSPNPACPNEEVYFGTTAYDANYTYLWNFGDGNQSSVNNASHIYSSVGSYPVMVTLTNSCGNNKTLSETLLVENDVPVSDVEFYTDQNSVCPNEEVYFDVWTYEGNYTYLWNFGDGNSVMASSETTHKFSSLGSYTVSVKITNPCGNDTTLEQIIEVVNNVPVGYVDYNINPNPVCPNDEVSFNAWGENDYTYIWNFGDGSPLYPGKYANHSYASTGSFPAWVKITNLCGSETYLYQTVQVQNNVPVTYTDYDIYPNPVCPNDEVSFQAYGNYSYLWNFGDGSPASTSEDTYHTYSAPGAYPVSVKMTNGCGNSATLNETVLVSNGLPVTNIYYEMYPNQVCPGDEVSFDVWGAAASYLWNFGDGSASSISDYTYHNYTSLGSYEASLKVSNSCGNDTTFYQNILVMNNIPVTDVDLYISHNPACPNDEITFEVSGNNSYSFEWNFGDGSPVSGNSYTYHAYATLGNYDVGVKITNACGRDTTLYATILVMNNVPVSYEDFSVSPNPVCPNGLVSFQAWSGAVTYEWNFGDGSPASNNSSTNHAYSTAGSYPASLKITNGCGNDMTFNETVYVENNLLPYADDYNYDVLQNQACPDDSIVFYVQSGSGNYLWDFGDGTTTTETTTFEAEDGYMVDMAYHSYSAVGNYTASFTLTNQCGNSFTDYFNIMIGNNIPVDGEFGWNIGYPAVGENIEFWAYGGSTYQFDFGDGTSPLTITTDLESIYHAYSSPGSYNISVTISNSCGNSVVYHDNIMVSGTLAIPGSAGPISGTNNVCKGQNSVIYTVPPITYATSYEWTLPVGATGTSTTKSISVNYGTIAVSGDISVKGTNSLGSGAISTLPVSVNVKPSKPAITINGNILHSSATEGNQWFNQNGLITGAVNQDYLVTSNGDYYVIVNLLGCSSDASNIIPKFFLCDAQFSYTWNGITQFTDLSVGTLTSRSWDFGDGTYSSLQNPPHIYTKDGAYMVTLTVFNILNNCVSSVTQKVIAGSEFPCEADFDFSINSVTGYTIFTSKSDGETNYYWDFSGGDFSIDKNPSYIFTKAGFFPVCLTIWNDTTGCQSVICKDILFIPESVKYIQADFSFFTDPADSTVVFSDLSTSNTTNWYWTMGDGKVLNTQNPVYSYSKPGIYEVCLTAFDEVNSISNSVCKEVRVSSILCAIGADFSYFIIPATLEVSFFSMATGVVTDYFWTFGDGTSSTIENPGHQYSSPGYYLVTLMVRNSNSKCLDAYSQFIQVGSVDCHAGFTFGVDQDISTVFFTDDSKGEIDYFYWDFGDGSFDVVQNPEKLYTKAGIYIVGQTVINSTSGCMDFSFQPVQVGTVDCSADFVSYIDSANYTGYFTNRILGDATAMLWSFGDGKFSTNENPVHVFPGEGIYSVGLNTYDFNSECMDYYEEMLLIGGLGEDCEADFAYGVDPTNPVVRFSNKSIGDIVSYIWNFGEYGSDNSTDENPDFTYIKGGYYNVCLTITNSSGTSNMSCKWVLVEGSAANDCRANFMFSIDSSTMKVTFVDNSFGNINKYTWDFGDDGSVSTDKNPIHTYGQAGYYLVQLKAENTVTGCVSNEYKLLNVADEQVLKAAFGYEAKEPDKKFAGYPVDLVSASSGDGATVEWDFGDKQLKKEFKYVMDSTSRIVTHYYANPGRYEVCLKISDPVSNQSDVYCSFVFTKNAIGIDQVMKSGINLSIYPNPLIDYTTINYTLEKPQLIEISIYDQLGRKIETLVKSRQDSGPYQITWTTKTQMSGVYHLKLVTTDGIITKQIVIAK